MSNTFLKEQVLHAFQFIYPSQKMYKVSNDIFRKMFRKSNLWDNSWYVTIRLLSKCVNFNFNHHMMTANCTEIVTSQLLNGKYDNVRLR